MMKAGMLLLLFACALAHADDLQFGELGFPFKAKDTEIVWKVATNRVPRIMNIYKVIPARFPLEMISNIVTLGEFKEPEKVKNALVQALKGKDAWFEEPGTRKYVSFSPQRGRISYLNPKAIPLPGQREAGLPTDDSVLKLALNTARLLGIKPSEVARKSDSDQLLLWRDKRTRGGLVDGKYLKREIARGIYLYRSVDGISFEGSGLCGGLYVNFGTDATVAEVDLSWRNLELNRSCQTADKDEITRRLRTGKAVIQIEDTEPSKIKTLTITNIVPHYRGYSSVELQAWVHPFVIIEATADFGDRKLPASFLCPSARDK